MHAVVVVAVVICQMIKQKTQRGSPSFIVCCRHRLCGVDDKRANKRPCTVFAVAGWSRIVCIVFIMD